VWAFTWAVIDAVSPDLRPTLMLYGPAVEQPAAPAVDEATMVVAAVGDVVPSPQLVQSVSPPPAT
jgi:hypothetical protein